ncbi:MAG: GDP-mannose 4,6-dehydratase [Candidatus Omnitrophica bacterium]|nr:GDP-mannose 4,6-dehydratase [Candidatus Omnitrophota bacterium]
MKTHVLVTGVCGLIGSHACDVLLRRGYTVPGVDDLSFGKMEHIARYLGRPNFRFVRANICRHGYLESKIKRCDRVLHLAAVKKVGESEAVLPTIKVNADGTESMLKFALAKKARFVLGSTSDVYGASEDVPFREDGWCRIGPSTAKRWAYAVAKLQAEHLVMGYIKTYGLEAVILRYFGGFSERSSSTWSGGHVPIFIGAVLRNKEIVIHGDGSQTRSMAHVDDLVRGTLLAMNRNRALGEIINIGNDEEVSVLDCAKRIHRLSGVRHPIKLKLVPMKKVFGTYREIPRRIPDLTKAKRLLGYTPRVNFDEALLRVIRSTRERMASQERATAGGEL